MFTPCFAKSVFVLSRPFSKILRLSIVMAIIFFFTMIQVEIRHMMELSQEDEFQRTLDMKRVVSFSEDDNVISNPDLLYIDIKHSRRNGKRMSKRVIHRVKPGKKTLLSETIVAGQDEESILHPAYYHDQINAERTNLGVPLQSWANGSNDFNAEAKRFLQYITTPQILCNDVREIGQTDSSDEWPLRVCFDDGQNTNGGGCVVYSFGPNVDGSTFYSDMARQGCEVHVFNPTTKDKAESYYDKSIFPHQYSLDWRETTVKGPSLSPWKPKKLSSIIPELGHGKVDVLQADLQGMEWKILENLISDETLNKLNQIILKIHIHWSGFEVQGHDAEVIRFWYSLLKQMASADFKIFYSYKHRSDSPQSILGHDVYNASGSYTIGWVKNDWR